MRDNLAQWEEKISMKIQKMREEEENSYISRFMDLIEDPRLKKMRIDFDNLCFLIECIAGFRILMAVNAVIVARRVGKIHRLKSE